MSFNIVHSLNQIADLIDFGTGLGKDKVQSLDEIIAGTTLSLAQLNQISIGLGGAGGATSILGALAQISLVLNGGPGANITAGTYTPTALAVNNVSSFTNVYDAQYMRVKSVVTVSGIVRFVTTLAAVTFTSFTLSLPIASDMTGAIQLAGAQDADPTLFTPQLVIGTGSPVGLAALGGVAINAPGTVLLSYTYTYHIQ